MKLKGVGDSFWVTLDPGEPAELLKEEAGKLFSRLKHLAVNARVVIDTGGGHDHLVDAVGNYLKKEYDVGLVSKPPEKPSPAEARVRQRDADRSWEHRKSDVLMMAGRVRSGQKVTAKKHLVIMGDVNPGAEIVAGGDILVMGRLCGTAVAGAPSDTSAIILALDFRPTQVQIGGFVAAGFPATPSKVAEFAHVEEGGIVVDDYLGNNPFGRMPWPKVR